MDIIDIRMWAVEQAMALLADEGADVSEVLGVANEFMMFLMLEATAQGETIVKRSGETEH